MANKDSISGPMIFLNPNVEVIGPGMGGFELRSQVAGKIVLLPGFGYDSIDAIFEGSERVWQNFNSDPINAAIQRSAYRGTQIVFNPNVLYRQGQNLEYDVVHILEVAGHQLLYSRGDFDAIFARDGTQKFELRTKSIR